MTLSLHPTLPITRRRIRALWWAFLWRFGCFAGLVYLPIGYLWTTVRRVSPPFASPRSPMDLGFHGPSPHRLMDFGFLSSSHSLLMDLWFLPPSDKTGLVLLTTLLLLPISYFALKGTLQKHYEEFSVHLIPYQQPAESDPFEEE